MRDVPRKRSKTVQSKICSDRSTGFAAGYVMEEYMKMEEKEEYRWLNREVNKMKKRIEVLQMR